MKSKKTRDPVEEALQFGIDITLLQERLGWSPTRRLEHHAQALTFVEELRRAGKKIHDVISKNS